MLQYIIPATLAFVGALTLWLIKRERISLEYSIQESEIFPKDTGNGKYFLLNLKNTGNKAVENINYKVELNKGDIESFQFSNNGLINIQSQENTILIGLIPLLNPNEELHATITINDAEDYSKIIIEARGVGITASESKKEQLPVYLQSTLALITIGVSISVAFSMYTSLSQEKVTDTIKSIDKIQDTAAVIKENNILIKDKLSVYDEELIKSKESLEALEKRLQTMKNKSEQGDPEREQIIFAILNKAGLSKVLPSLLASSGDGLAFWKTGLFLIHSYVIDKQNASKYISALEQMSNVNFIAPSSKGFLLYLAGKIEKEEGNTSQAIHYFDSCKKETPLMYEHLMAQDPAYDLKSIQIWLNKKTP